MANLRTHIDLDEVEATPAACGPHTRHALVAAARALIAYVEHDRLDDYELDDLNEPWASAVRAIQPFRAEADR